eukprot:TRINITY_DN5379_c0_g1_i1.p1 TRINITY_DN5379_c0_g1~~TRINITY_DN5379_c0_g1_i1.p1  ORF type:complete len:2125 (+),score=588.22 TRINITY_DN5379_c0_g1_i1:192-6377(+)
MAKASPVTLACDFSSFLFDFLLQTEDSFPGIFTNLLGGEYALFDHALTAYFNQLSQHNIKLICVFDPASGTEQDFQRKLATIRKRFESNLQAAQEIVKFCDSPSSTTGDASVLNWMVPTLARHQLLATLRRIGVDVRFSFSEADVMLANLCRSGECYAVLSRDSDFCVFSGCRYIPTNFFPLCADGSVGFAADSPVLARVFSAESVARALQIRVTQLIDLAALCGNDITGHVLDEIPIADRLGIPSHRIPRTNERRSRPEAVAAYLRQFPGMRLSDLLDADRDAAFVKVAAQSETFYTDCDAVAWYSGVGKLGPAVEQYLRQGFLVGEMPSSLFAIYRHQRFWGSVHLESLHKSGTSVAVLHRPLRQAMYRLLGQDSVTEYLGSFTNKVVETTVKASTHTVPKLSEVLGKSMADRAQILHEIAHAACRSTAPHTVSQDPLLQFGPGVYAVGVGLRYTCALNAVKPSPALADFELEALLATAVLCSAGRQDAIQAAVARSSEIKPCSRQLFVNSLFQTAMLTLLDVARVLGVAQSFPEPCQYHSGILFHDFYTHREGGSWKNLLSQTQDGAELQRLLGVFAAVKQCVLSALPPNTVKGDVIAPVAAVASSPKATPPQQSPTKPFPSLKALAAALPDTRSALESDVVLAGPASDESTDSEMEQDGVDFTEAEALVRTPSGTADALGSAYSYEDIDEDAPLQALPDPPKPAVMQTGGPLPVEAHREKILLTVRANRVTCIQGETGCGKSSVVPQMLLADAAARGEKINIVCTQPRRIAAIMLAKRVASCLKEPLGETVGFRIAREGQTSAKTKLTFVTIGYLLHLLAHDPGQLSKYTHILLDEIHERSMDGDLLCLLLKVTMPQQELANQVKLVIMSATLQANLFRDYFTFAGLPAPAQPIFVGANCYPVGLVYLEQLAKQLPNLNPHAKAAVAKLSRDFAVTTGSGGRTFLPKAEVSDQMMEVIVHVVLALAQPQECVLVFLPGIGEITTCWNMFERIAPRAPIHLLALHSTVPREEQEAAFAPPPDGLCKVILSTNIAESSVTIPDVLYVIDAGLQREIQFVESRGMPALMRSWCSQASGKQRQGRAGRVRPGLCFRMYTQQFHEQGMPAFDSAEILRLPLESIVLHVKTLMSDLGSVSDLLRQTVEAPSQKRITVALNTLAQLGALSSAREDSTVTALGHIAVGLPLDISLSKLVLLGLAFGCEADAIVMAASLSVQDVFSLPSKLFMRDAKAYAEALKESYAARAKFDAGQCSEPLMYRALYIRWLQSRRDISFSKRHSLSHTRMLHLDSMVADIAHRLLEHFQSPRATSHTRVNLDTLKLLCTVRSRYDNTTEVAKLLTSKPETLRFILTASCAPTFLTGSVSHISSSRKDIIDAGMDPVRTICLSKVPVELKQVGVLAQNLLGCVGVAPKKHQFVKRGCLIEFAADIVPADAAPQPAACMTILPMAANMLYQLQGNRQLELPNYKEPLVTGDMPEFRCGMLSNMHKVEWKCTGASTAKAMLNWRMPVACATEARLHVLQHVAIAASLMGTEAPNMVRAVGVTVLPQENLFAAVMLLVLAGSSEAVHVRVNENVEAVAARIGSTIVSFAPRVLTASDLQRINEVRAAVTAVLFDSSLPVKQCRDAMHALQELLTDIGQRPAVDRAVSEQQQTSWFELMHAVAADSEDSDRVRFLPQFQVPGAQRLVLERQPRDYVDAPRGSRAEQRQLEKAHRREANEQRRLEKLQLKQQKRLGGMQPSAATVLQPPSALQLTTPPVAATEVRAPPKNKAEWRQILQANLLALAQMTLSATEFAAREKQILRDHQQAIQKVRSEKNLAKKQRKHAALQEQQALQKQSGVEQLIAAMAAAAVPEVEQKRATRSQSKAQGIALPDLPLLPVLPPLPPAPQPAAAKQPKAALAVAKQPKQPKQPKQAQQPPAQQPAKGKKEKKGKKQAVVLAPPPPPPALVRVSTPVQPVAGPATPVKGQAVLQPQVQPQAQADDFLTKAERKKMHKDQLRELQKAFGDAGLNSPSLRKKQLRPGVWEAVVYSGSTQIARGVGAKTEAVKIATTFALHAVKQ